MLWRDGPRCDGWCFAEVGRALGVDTRIESIGLAIAAYELDGDFDMYVFNTWDEVLLRNDGSEFTDVAAASGATAEAASWGTFIGDLDWDRDEDLFLATGEGWTR
jgi:hypothetical protein